MRPVDPQVPPLRFVAVRDGGASDDDGPTTNVVLTAEQRAKSRVRVRLADGRDAAVLLARDSVVRPGSRLVADSGEVVRVVAASERVHRVVARSDSPDPAFDLLRAAYHLGNRHVPVELGRGFLKLERDPVLQALLVRLGLEVAATFEPFDPEPGAYGGGHRHGASDPVEDADDAAAGAIGEALSRDAHARRLRATDVRS